MKELFIQETTVKLASGAVGVQDYVAVAGQIFFFFADRKTGGSSEANPTRKTIPSWEFLYVLIGCCPYLIPKKKRRCAPQ